MTIEKRKVVIIGDYGAGKTSLLLRHLKNEFPEDPNPTLGASFEIFHFNLQGNRKVDIQMWDTSGEEKFKSVTLTYFNSASCAIIVFDVSNPK